MHIYLVICLIKRIFNSVYIIKGFKVQLTITFFWMIMVKNCHLNFESDKNSVTFFYVAASGPLHLALFFYLLNWNKIVQIFHHMYLFTMFILLDEQFLVLEQLRLTDFVKFYLNYQPALIYFT